MTEAPDAGTDNNGDETEGANDPSASPAEQAKTREREMEESGDENAA